MVFAVIFRFHTGIVFLKKNRFYTSTLFGDQPEAGLRGDQTKPIY